MFADQHLKKSAESELESSFLSAKLVLEDLTSAGQLGARAAVGRVHFVRGKAVTGPATPAATRMPKRNTRNKLVLSFSLLKLARHT